MDYIQGFINNKGVNIHYIDNDVLNTNTTPLLICPGLSESVKDYIKLMESIKDRRCIVFSFRGRGKSDISTEGYSLESHVEDIESVVRELSLNKFCIMGISRGVSYVLGYSIYNTNLLRGVILNEYPPEHKEMQKGWAKESIEFYEKHCDSISITYDVLKSIEDDSKSVSFVKDLVNIKCPSLILKGELEGTLIDSKDIVDYIDNLGSNSIRLERFSKAGHDIQSDDFEGLIKVINEFLKSID